MAAELYVGDFLNKVRVVIDSGSVYSCMSEDFACQLLINNLTCKSTTTPPSLSAANNKRRDVLYQLNVKVGISDKQCITVSFCVVKIFSQDDLLDV